MCVKLIIIMRGAEVLYTRLDTKDRWSTSSSLSQLEVCSLDASSTRRVTPSRHPTPHPFLHVNLVYHLVGLSKNDVRLTDEQLTWAQLTND